MAFRDVPTEHSERECRGVGCILVNAMHGLISAVGNIGSIFLQGRSNAFEFANDVRRSLVVRSQVDRHAAPLLHGQAAKDYGTLFGGKVLKSVENH